MMYIKKLLLCFIVVFSTMGLHLSAHAQSVEKNRSLESVFNFWLGHWQVSWDEGEGKKGTGINRIERVLDGKAIQENFQVLQGKSAGFKGSSLSVLELKTGQWKQAWVDNKGGYFSFDGVVEGNKRIFKTQMKNTAGGKEVAQRMVFHSIKEDSFQWDWQGTEDGGKSWEMKWQIHYTRVK